jgi:hypothetical protein
MSFLVPKAFFLTKGIGVHKEQLTAFELALRDADIERQNLVTVARRSYLRGVSSWREVQESPHCSRARSPSLWRRMSQVGGSTRAPVWHVRPSDKAATMRKPMRQASWHQQW